MHNENALTAESSTPHLDKEIVNGEEDETRSEKVCKKAVAKENTERERDKEKRKKKREEVIGEREGYVSSKNLRRASIAAVAFAPHLLLSARLPIDDK